MIAFVLAQEEEIASIAQIDKNFKVYQSSFFKYYLLQKNNKKFVFVFCGVGKANAAACTTELIGLFSPTYLINIGIAGTNKTDFEFLDIVLLERNYYLDVDATYFNYELGQIPREEKYFENNDQLNLKIETLFNKNQIQFKKCYGASCDSFVNLFNLSHFSNPIFNLVSCIEMEATAIKQIAFKAKVATAFIKIVSDNIWNNISSEQFEQNYLKLQTKICMIIKLLINSF
ncbi:MAG: 5'-methylthioadenosine/S-adenosylhomocysteine nucleosidase [Malacoplasma sp.]|nr:5'-methylthioadenosine/S-adenosylhomocysteine nucleosidase [Malacoplasma sp.]